MTDAARRSAFDVLCAALRPLGRAVVAFSGGADSALLLCAASRALPGGVLAVTFDLPYVPAGEVRAAAALAATLPVRHRIVTLPFPEALRANPPERCYRCKRLLFERLAAIAGEEAGGAALLDGSNLDDAGEHRPGLRALRELGVRSPLLDAGLTKRDVRDLSRAAGLPTWDKPAGSCLLTRLPHGATVEAAELRRIDAGEALLRELGFPVVRLRSHGATARIEVPRESLDAVLAADRRHGVDARLKALGYAHVALDLAGYRRGGLDGLDGDAGDGGDSRDGGAEAFRAAEADRA